MLSLPNFLIAGAQKAGTTYLWRMLESHPQVCLAVIKEPTFFTRVPGCGEHSDGRLPRYSGRYERGLEWYSSLFPNRPQAAARGEASTQYMSEPDAAGLIHQHIPEVRLVFLLRDPVARVYSHYWQEVKEGWKLPDFSVLVNQRDLALQRYIYVSDYARHLERFLQHFPREQLGIFLFDDLVLNPLAVFQQVCQLIGVAEDFRPLDLGQAKNSRGNFRSLRINRWLGRMAYSWRLSLKSPPPAWVSRLAEKLGRYNRKPAEPAGLSPELRGSLLLEFDDTISYVEEYLGRALPGWRANPG